MTTRAELRTLVRTELNDVAATKLWSDALLNQWISEAVREYGRHEPREATTTLTTTANQADYPLPSDLVTILRVEHPPGIVRRAERAADGTDLTDSPDWPTYEVYGGTLTLRPAPAASGEAIALRYLGQYAVPAADGDTLATPPVDDDLLVWLVCARALAWLGTDEAKRQRFERERGVSAAEVAAHYAARVAAGLVERRRRPVERRLVVR